MALFDQMRAWGSALVAITDHDTLAGVRELFEAGRGRDDGDGLVIIPGVEINTRVDATVAAAGDDLDVGELHILGFGVDIDDTRFEETLAGQRAGRRRRIERTVARLDDLGIDVRDHLPKVPGGIDALGRPHVARALVSTGHAESVDDAFRRYLEPGAPAYVVREGIGPRAAIDAIVGAGGIASLAHAPWAASQPGVIDLLCEWGMGALEVHYHAFDDDTVERMAAVARGHGLLETGGSDFHGDTMDYAESQATTYVPPEVGERFLAALGPARAAEL